MVLGSTGEAILLSDDERREALKTSRDAASNDKVLIAGTGVESAIETLRLTEYAYDIGYDVAMVRTPHYYKGQMANPQNMLAFYRFVCDRSPLPVIIYNFPQATGYDIPAELVIELAEHPNLIGIKESSGSIEKVQKMVEGTRHITRKATVTETFAAVTGRMLQAAATPPSSEGVALVSIEAPSASAASDKATALKPSSRAVKVVGSLKTRQKEVGFQVLVGAAQKLAPSLDVGAVGAILAFADCAPTACYEIYAAWKEGDMRPRPREAGPHREGCATHCGRTQHPGREVRHGLQRPLRRPSAPAPAPSHRRQEGRGRAVAGEHSELRISQPLSDGLARFISFEPALWLTLAGPLRRVPLNCHPAISNPERRVVGLIHSR